MGKVVLQEWVLELPLMQQTVLLTAMDGAVLSNPTQDGGGSFTGPMQFPPQEARPVGAQFLRVYDDGSMPRWEWVVSYWAGQYLRELDATPLHFHMHLVHAFEIVGYKHVDQRIRSCFFALYERFVHNLHLWPETVEQMDVRLGDDRSGWLARNDPATIE